MSPDIKMEANQPEAGPGQPRLLFNRTSRTKLTDAGLQQLHDTPLDLTSVRRIASWQGVNGTRLYLLAQLNAALQWVCLRHLAHHRVTLQWDTIHIDGACHPFRALGPTCRQFQDSYALRDLPAAALRPEGRGKTVAAARHRLVSTICLLDVQLGNPALDELEVLFSEQDPERRQRYSDILDCLTDLQPVHPNASRLEQPLRTLLESPRRKAPFSLEGQVAYVLEQWGDWLPEGLKRDLSVARAIVLEEAQPRAPGPGPVQLPNFGRDDTWTPAAFTPDTDWMPNAVLLAKSIHVWLGQLSRQYAADIRTLGQIPDAELDRLANWGINALWLIGIWQRSKASRSIKRQHGNLEAEASAYALDSYRVAADLGGEEGLANLDARCKSRGIQLACDVVPNHTGIDAEWVRHHPDWYIQSEAPPYPSYRFSGPDLCDDPAISIRIEDGYWNHSDAAVVFEHRDHHTGRRRYIYHGNDGTHMPWNDTAQLNFLLPEVRQVMSNLIVDVARRFRLIRFDAAMTLARKHFRRLWFPPPGGSAGVPSRSNWWLSNEDFDRAFPMEFWREVVDRINREVPDTLLIAEAFWLMESYFVRNLGMHRVYNSAFMNLLKREENAKYRRILKDVLAYNPEILKRYVNFMNNPDEATAVEQFGKGDKYFGTAILLATLPGLPMFGHGQIEGYREKYGMEFRKAYWDEQPDQGFIAHHEAQICPWLRQRRLFSEVRHFALYDLITEQGVNENVFIYSNGTDNERCLVAYNNSPESAHGHLSRSAPKALPEQEGQPEPGQALAENLGLKTAGVPFCRFRDHRDGLEYLHPSRMLQEGLEITLGGYQYHLFHDFRLQADPDGTWARLCQHLNGQGTPNLDAAALRFRQPELWEATRQLFAPQRLSHLAQSLPDFPLSADTHATLENLGHDFDAWCNAFGAANEADVTPTGGAALLERCHALSCRVRQGLEQVPALSTLWKADQKLGVSLLCWLLCDELTHRFAALQSPSLLLENFKRFGLDLAWQETWSGADIFLIELLSTTAVALPHPAENREAFRNLIRTDVARKWLHVNRFEAETWFDRERMQWLCAALALQRLLLPTGSIPQLDADLKRYKKRIERAEAAGFRLDKFQASAEIIPGEKSDHS